MGLEIHYFTGVCHAVTVHQPVESWSDTSLSRGYGGYIIKLIIVDLSTIAPFFLLFTVRFEKGL